MSSVNLDNRFALDVASLERLKEVGRRDADAGLDAAAVQFEALFLNRLMASMRDAVPRSGLLDSQQTRLLESLFDQQLSQHLAGKGLGLAEQLIRDLGGKAPARSGQR